MPDDPSGTQAGATADTGADPNTQTDLNTGDTGTQQPKYTEDEMKKLLQTEADRRVTDAMKKKQKEIDELKHQMELQKLTDDERKEAEKKQQEEEIKKERELLEAEKTDFETLKVIADKKLNPELLNLVKPLKALDDRKKVFDLFEQEVKTEVESRLKAMQRDTFPTPQKGSKYIHKTPEKTPFDKVREKL